MRMYDLIMKKRKGEELTTEEITLDCSEKYRSSVTTFKFANINTIYKVKE